jgi:hypothetical protein
MANSFLETADRLRQPGGWKGDEAMIGRGRWTSDPCVRPIGAAADRA